MQTGSAFEIFALAGALAGGLGLFLLAIVMMTDGLQLAAGPSLRKLLSDWSSTPLKGVFSGFAMTALVQSSSAVTVASLGFVNAGLISVRQSLGIVYGANVGTTVTGWLVVLVGFELNVQAFALPLIGAGMLLRLFKKSGRAPAFGLAMAGFGLFFLGIDILKSAFETMVQTFDFEQINAQGIRGLVSGFLIGIVLTILTQSSSASIALTITAASSGVIDIYPAAAMVIGANLGTTSTAVIASIGATSNARRVAAAQVLFNGTTAIVAFILLPVLFLIIGNIEKIAGLNTELGVTLALFHTVFNVLGVLLIFPFNDRLAVFLQRRFLSWEEKESNPRYLDRSIAVTPVLAVNAVTLELQAIAGRIVELCDKSSNFLDPDIQRIKAEIKVIKVLSREVSRFIASVEGAALSEKTVNNLAVLMRIDQYLLACTASAEHLAELVSGQEQIAPGDLQKDLLNFSMHAVSAMRQTMPNKMSGIDMLEEVYAHLHAEYEQVKSNLILYATRSRISVSQMSESVEFVTELMHCVKQWKKAMQRLHAVQVDLGSVEADDAEEPLNLTAA
ncbi:MAG: Na/Pi symporter [Pseudomonadales bacterium]